MSDQMNITTIVRKQALEFIEKRLDEEIALERYYADGMRHVLVLLREKESDSGGDSPPAPDVGAIVRKIREKLDLRAYDTGPRGQETTVVNWVDIEEELVDLTDEFLSGGDSQPAPDVMAVVRNRVSMILTKGMVPTSIMLQVMDAFHAPTLLDNQLAFEGWCETLDKQPTEEESFLEGVRLGREDSVGNPTTMAAAVTGTESPIHPKSVTAPDGTETQRTAWQEGWNAGVMAVNKEALEILKRRKRAASLRYAGRSKPAPIENEPES